MQWKKVREFAEGRGWVFRSESFFGVEEGIPFAVARLRRGKSQVYVLNVRVLGDDAGRSPKELARQFKELRRGGEFKSISSLRVVPGTAVFTVGGGFGGVEERLIGAVTLLPSLLSALLLNPDGRCIFCGGTDCDRTIVFGNELAVRAHAACQQRSIEEFEQKIQEEQSLHGSRVLQGTVGALAGAVVGTVITAAGWMVLPTGSGSNSQIKLMVLLYLFTVFLARTGYKLAAKHFSKAAPFIVAVLTVAGALLALPLSGFLSDIFTRGLSARAAAGSVWFLLLHDAATRGQMLGYTALGLFMTAVGIGIMWRTMAYTPEAELEDMKNAMIG